MQWNKIMSVEDIEGIVETSHAIPCLIFKHSTRCPVSALAKHRLENEWDFDEKTLQPYYLDLIRFREVSNYIAERFSVFHESPQVLLIRDGDCTYDASHLDITVEELKQCYEGC